MTKEISIKLIDSSLRDDWDRYVMQHTEGTVSHLWAWRDAVENSFNHSFYSLVALKDSVDIVGVLPLCRVKSRLFGHYMVAAPFAEMGGLLSDNSKAEQALLAYAKSISSEFQCDYVELKNSKKIDGLYTKDLYFNFSKELLPEVEENMLAIPRKSRAAVRKGIKSGLTIQFGDDQFDSFYELMARSYHNLGTPVFAKDFFRNFLTAFKENIEIAVVRTKEGMPVSAVLTLYFKDRIMPYYAGSLPGYRNLCPNDFMYWELLKRGLAKGYRIFDYGRSKVNTGSYKFKKNWGFEPQPLYYQYQLINLKEMPNLSPANPKYAKKIEMWRKMPFTLTKIAGPPLAKYLA